LTGTASSCEVEVEEEVEEEGDNDDTTEVASADAGAAVAATQGAVALGIATSISSPQGAWSMVNQFQVLMLMPLTGAYFPPKVISFLTGMRISLFSFNIIPLKSVPGLNYILNLVDFEQKDEYFTGKIFIFYQFRNGTRFRKHIYK
jgi:hypothetical protein